MTGGRGGVWPARVAFPGVAAEGDRGRSQAFAGITLRFRNILRI